MIGWLRRWLDNGEHVERKEVHEKAKEAVASAKEAIKVSRTTRQRAVDAYRIANGLRKHEQ
jgi:hypothetical protein